MTEVAKRYTLADFHVLHATSDLIPLFAGSLSPLDPYIVMLYISKSKNQ